MSKTTTSETAPAQPCSRADISRTNGSKSRGPKTPEGKARSSMNATKFGLFAKTIVLPEENRAEFQALLDAHIARHQPDGEDEWHLVHTMALCQWQERRVWKAETAKLTDRLQDASENDKNWDDRSRIAVSATPSTITSTHSTPWAGSAAASPAITSAPSRP